ncbi:hypothetical protein PMAC_001424 [Pneumocystis sp. 'macacae']|nr:hypothetical protein PMAC_001424 [Pneumocystis sp. 'macacae']
MYSECSIPGCILWFLQVILPRGFTVTYSSCKENSGLSGLLDNIADQVPTVLSGLTECLSSHNLASSKNKGSDCCPPQQNQDPSPCCQQEETTCDKDPKKGLFQSCTKVAEEVNLVWNNFNNLRHGLHCFLFNRKKRPVDLEIVILN